MGVSFNPSTYRSELQLARTQKGRAHPLRAGARKDPSADTSISALAPAKPTGAKETTVTNNAYMARKAKLAKEKLATRIQTERKRIEAAVKAERRRLGLPEPPQGTTNVQRALAEHGAAPSGSSEEQNNNPEFNAKHPRAGGRFTSGASGPHVGSAQQQLNSLGYQPGKVDSQFGPKTESAVKSFQANNKLQVDGVVGPQTLQKLYSTSAAKA